MLCCKEIVPERAKKSSKNTSMLRKDKTASKAVFTEKRKLSLKGRIFVSNINRATLLPADPSDPNSTTRLTIAWTVPHRQPNGWHEEVEDAFVMSGKSEEQMKKWGDKVVELATSERRRQEEQRQERIRLNGRFSNSERQYQHSSFAPPTPGVELPPFSFPPPMPEEDEYDASGFRSGRTTPSMVSSSTYVSHSYGPSAGRRVQSQQAMPVDRQAELRARAMTEDQFGPSMTQWRSQQPPPPLPRLTSAMSALSTNSAASDVSFGTQPQRTLRQMSSSRLGRADEEDEDSPTEIASGYGRYTPSRGMSRTPSQGVIAPTVPNPHRPPFRSRSASSPNVYQIPQMTAAQIPPVPNTAWAEPSAPSLAPSSTSTLVGGTAYFNKRTSGGGKRSSSESHSTETSETSSQQSPATPYATVGGDGRGNTPVSRQNSQDAVTSGGPSMLVRIRCGEVSSSCVP